MLNELLLGFLPLISAGTGVMLKHGFIWLWYIISCNFWPRILRGPAKFGAAGLLLCIVCMFCGIWVAGMFGMFIGMWQTLQYLFTFFIYPVIIAPGIIGDIIKCNAEFLALIYGMFVLEVASRTLTPATAGMMSVVWLLLVVRAIWKGMSS